jgi:chromosomal replication initiation ATPase DnaA
MLNNQTTYSDTWQSCLNKIKEQTSEAEFVKWFEPIEPLDFDGTTLRLRVPNESYVYQIEKNYIPFLKPAFDLNKMLCHAAQFYLTTFTQTVVHQIDIVAA